VPGEHHHLQPLEQHRLDDQEITDEDGVRPRGQELPPGQPRPAGRWIDARSVQHLPLCGRRDRVPEPRQLTLDPPMDRARFSRAIPMISALTEHRQQADQAPHQPVEQRQQHPEMSPATLPIPRQNPSSHHETEFPSGTPSGR